MEITFTTPAAVPPPERFDGGPLTIVSAVAAAVDVGGAVVHSVGFFLNNPAPATP